MAAGTATIIPALLIGGTRNNVSLNAARRGWPKSAEYSSAAGSKKVLDSSA
jgi:hypothetical protein